MSYGHRKVKTEMKGTGGGRWEGREIAKKRSNKARRVGDKKATGKERFRVAVLEFVSEHRELLLKIAKTEVGR